MMAKVRGMIRVRVRVWGMVRFGVKVRLWSGLGVLCRE